MTTRETTFHSVGLAAGAEMRELFGYWLPWQYARGPVEEHIATRERVSVCDLDYMAEFRIEGTDAAAFVQNLLTNDFAKLAVGQIRYTAMCRPDGGMVDDGTLWRTGPEEFVLITGNEDDSEWIGQQVSGLDVEITNLTDSWTTLAVQGPRSRAVVANLVESTELDVLRYYRFLRTTVLGSSCLVARMGYTGETGYEFHLDPQGAEALWNAILEAGAEYDILPCGQAALESLRQEAGYLLVGNDHDPSTNPFEAGIGRVVRFSKPDFIGREALAAIRRDGVDRIMVWLRLSDDTVADPGATLSVDGRQIGSVTSGSYSPTLRRGVAMGYVEPRFAVPGISIDVGPSEASSVAVLSPMPLYDPGDSRTRTGDRPPSPETSSRP